LAQSMSKRGAGGEIEGGVTALEPEEAGRRDRAPSGTPGKRTKYMRKNCLKTKEEKIHLFRNVQSVLFNPRGRKSS